MTLLLAVAAGILVGLSLGALGAGGSVLAVPILVYLLDQSPGQATTGSLVVVGVTALFGSVASHRAGNVMLARGVAFGLAAIGGAAVGAVASTRVPDAVLLAAFAALMMLIAALMVHRQVRDVRDAHQGGGVRPPHGLDGPIVAVAGGFLCDCPRALKLLVTATMVGLLTGFLGVGGGFLVIPALILVFALPMKYAAGTSLVAITLISAAALAVRTGAGAAPDWGLVAALTGASAVGALAGARLAGRVSSRALLGALTAVVLAVACFTAASAVPALT